MNSSLSKSDTELLSKELFDEVCEVLDDGMELRGVDYFVPVLRDGVPLEGRWAARLADGTTINVRSVSSSGVSRWTIDVQNKEVWSPLVGRYKVELKFK